MSRPRLRRGQRLTPDARRESLLAVAGELLLEQGYLPLSVQSVADGAKVSKALVYKYFPGPQDLYNGLLKARLGVLELRLDQAMRGEQGVVALTTIAAEIYYRYVAETGPLIHLILRDRFMAGQVSQAALAVRDRAARLLVRAVRDEFALPARQAVACLSIGLTMPEECGRLAYQGDLDFERGAVLCRELVLGVVDVARRGGLEARR